MLTTASWPMAGRAGELDAIESIFESRSSSGVVLAGGAGVGKSRLGAEALARAGARGYATARVLGSQAAGAVPLGALLPLLPNTMGETSGPADVLRWAISEIRKLGSHAPLAMLVDDSHLLDDMSAALVRQLAVDGEVRLIVTVRSGEPAPDAIVAMWKDGLVERMDVAPLAPDAVEELLVAVLGAAVETSTVRQLYDVTRGNPLYLRELVRAAGESGSIRDVGGLWRLIGPLTVSAHLGEIVERRFRELADDERDVLELLAFGERVGVSILERSGSASLVEALERQGLIVVEVDGKRLDARLAHPMYGEVLRAHTPVLRARRVHLTLGEAIEATGARRKDDALRVAGHLLAAGSTASPALMLQAAAAARWRWDLDLAERLARGAADGGAGFEAGLLLAQIALCRGRATEAEEIYASLVDHASDDDERATLAYSRIDNLLVGLDRPDRARAVAEELRGAMTDPAALDRTTSRLASVLFIAGRPRDCLVLMEPLIDAASGVALVEACTVGAMSLAQSGRLAEAERVSERALEAYLDLGGPPQSFGSHVSLAGKCQALIFSGRIEGAEDFVGSNYQRATQSHDGEGQASFAQFLALIALLRGHVMTAARYANEAVALYRERKWGPHLRRSLGTLVHALALGGNVEGAQAAAGEMDALDLTAQVALALEIESRAWLTSARGEDPDAVRLFEEAADVALERGDLVYATAVLHSLVRAGGDARHAAQRLDEVAVHVEGPLASLRVEHARAVASADGERAEAVSARFEEHGLMLYAAEAAAAASAAWRRSEEPRRSAAAERRAATLARRCEGAMTPPLRELQSQTLLTAREVEVAGLAAAGLSNREIAERLTVSVRTVETQLQRVYGKLGVRGRSELAEALEL